MEEFVRKLPTLIHGTGSCPGIASDFPDMTSQMFSHGDVNETLWLISISADTNGAEDDWCDEAGKSVTDETKVDEGIFVYVSQDLNLDFLRKGRERRSRHDDDDKVKIGNEIESEAETEVYEWSAEMR